MYVVCSLTTDYTFSTAVGAMSFSVFVHDAVPRLAALRYPELVAVSTAGDVTARSTNQIAPNGETLPIAGIGSSSLSLTPPDTGRQHRANSRDELLAADRPVGPPPAATVPRQLTFQFVRSDTTSGGAGGVGSGGHNQQRSGEHPHSEEKPRSILQKSSSPTNRSAVKHGFNLNLPASAGDSGGMTDRLLFDPTERFILEHLLRYAKVPKYPPAYRDAWSSVHSGSTVSGGNTTARSAVLTPRSASNGVIELPAPPRLFSLLRRTYTRRAASAIPHYNDPVAPYRGKFGLKKKRFAGFLPAGDLFKEVAMTKAQAKQNERAWLQLHSFMTGPKYVERDDSDDDDVSDSGEDSDGDGNTDSEEEEADAALGFGLGGGGGGGGAGTARAEDGAAGAGATTTRTARTGPAAKSAKTTGKADRRRRRKGGRKGKGKKKGKGDAKDGSDEEDEKNGGDKKKNDKSTSQNYDYRIIN